MSTNLRQRLGRRGGIAVGVTLSLVSGILVAPGLVGTASAAAFTGVHVQKGGYRTGTATVSGLSGAVFNAYKVASSTTTTVPGGAPAATCTTNAAGACDLPLTGLTSTTYVLVVEQSSPAGWDKISTLATGSTSSTSASPYVVNVTLNSGNAYTATAPSSSRSWANRLQNPAFPDKCGLNIAVLFDQSSSIDSGEMSQMKTAATGFVTALTGTPSKVALYTFATSAPGNNPNYALQSVQTGAGATIVNNRINAMANAGNGYTNWDQGLYQIATSSESYDVALVLTDGDPTVFHTGATSTNVTQQNVEEAVHSANAIKHEGTKVIGVGIGMDADSVNNIAAITGPTANSDYYTTNFANLGATLAAIAQKSCGGTVTVEKQVDSFGTVAPANGWTFSGAISANGGSVVPVSGATSTVNGFDGQLVFTLTGGTWPKTFTATETAQPGYTLQGVQCYLNGSPRASTTSGTSVTVPVDAKDAVRCVFTNSRTVTTIAPPAKPVPVPPTCSVDGSLTLVDGDHYTWNGSHNLGVGTHVVTATAATGYQFTGGATTVSYTVTVLPKTNDCPAVLVAPTVVPPTCSVAGSVTLPANTGTVTYSKVQVGLVVTVTATTQAPYVFSATPGWVVSANKLTATYTVTVAGPTNDCPATLVNPTVVPPTCSVAGSVTLPANTGTVTYSKVQSGLVVTVTATTQAPYAFSATPGWVVSANKLTATYTVTVAGPTNDCPAVLVAPTVVPPTCSVGGYVTLPADTATVSYSQGTVGQLVTVTATTQVPYVFSATPGWVVSADRLSATFAATVLPPTDECVIPVPVLTPVPPTCSVDGSVTLVDTADYTWLGDVDVLGVGTHTVTAQAAEGLLFPGYVSTASVTVTVLPATNDCPAVLVAPTVVPPTCSVGGYVTLPADTATVSYSQGTVGQLVTVTATTQVPYVFSATPGWVVSADRLSATFAATVLPPTDECVIPVPVLTPVPPTCSVDGSVTLVDTADYTWLGDVDVLGVGTHTVTAQAAEGLLFPGYVSTASVTVTVLPATNDCPAVLVAPTVVPPTCSAAGYVTLPANTATVTYSQSQVDLAVTVTATTQVPYVLTPANGWTVSQDGLSATFETAVAGPTNDCPAALEAPTVVEPTCSAAGYVTLPGNTDSVTYSQETVGLTVTVTATTQAPFVFSATPGWVVSEDGLTATFTVDVAGPTNDCPVTPVDPTITAQPVCTGPGTSAPGSFTVPEDSELVSYTVEGDVVTATTQAPYRFTAAQGWTVSEDGLSATFTVVFTPAGDCLVEAVPVEPVVEASASCGIEGTYTIPEIVGVTYWVDGEPIAAGTYDGPFSGTISATADQGYVLPEGEWSFALELAAAEACPVIVIVTPVDPTVTQSDTCEVEGSYTIPTTAGVTYLLDGAPIAAGTYPGPASGTITASAQEGSELVDSSWSFDLALAAAAACADNPGTLPNTGSSALGLGTVGAIVILLGAMLAVLGVRRREDDTQG